MTNPRFALYNTNEDKILCKKFWKDTHGNTRINWLWAKVKESHYVLLSSSGLDSLIDHINGDVEFCLERSELDLTHAQKAAQFLMSNGFDKDLIIVPIKKVGFSYTDELILEGLDFVNGFRV